MGVRQQMLLVLPLCEVNRQHYLTEKHNKGLKSVVLLLKSHTEVEKS